MEIRRYEPEDLDPMVRLFYDTVHAINIRDYTEAQVRAWAPGSVDRKAWDASFRRHLTYVATENGRIAGFGDMDETGYLDRLYVHKDFQGRGIATAICDRLENETEAARIEVHASITAKPFFEKRGYRTVSENAVERADVVLTNYTMKKEL